MAKIKDTPNLPASSRMQMPSTSGSMTKQTSGKMGSNSGSVTSKVMSAAKAGKGMKGSNPYC
jgi:hypothetical protein